MAEISIALSKGRIFDETVPLLARVGLKPKENGESSRKLIVDTDRADVRLIIVRATDTPTYVQHGGADLGIAGRDVLVEHGGEGLYQPVDLGIAACRIDSTHLAAAQLERAGLTGQAEALRAATARVQDEMMGVDSGGYSGDYRLLPKRTRDGGIVFWIRDASAADDMNALFRMMLAEAANVPELFRQRFLSGQTVPVRRAIACPKGGYELHVDLRS